MVVSQFRLRGVVFDNWLQTIQHWEHQPDLLGRGPATGGKIVDAGSLSLEGSWKSRGAMASEVGILQCGLSLDEVRVMKAEVMAALESNLEEVRYCRDRILTFMSQDVVDPSGHVSVEMRLEPVLGEIPSTFGIRTVSVCLKGTNISVGIYVTDADPQEDDDICSSRKVLSKGVAGFNLIVWVEWSSLTSIHDTVWSLVFSDVPMIHEQIVLSSIKVDIIETDASIEHSVEQSIVGAVDNVDDEFKPDECLLTSTGFSASLTAHTGFRFNEILFEGLSTIAVLDDVGSFTTPENVLDWELALSSLLTLGVEYDIPMKRIPENELCSPHLIGEITSLSLHHQYCFLKPHTIDLELP